MRMAELKAGDYFQDFVGPLGQPSEFVKEDLEEVKKRKYLFVAGGVGSAPVYPQVKWMHEHGIDVDVIEGSKTKSLLILDEILASCNYGMVQEQSVVEFLKNRPSGLEVVLTGRNPSETFLELADYVSEICMRRHPYEKGIPARRGIEF